MAVKTQAAAKPTFSIEANGKKQVLASEVEHFATTKVAIQEAIDLKFSTRPASTLTTAEATAWLAALGERTNTAWTSAQLQDRIQDIIRELPKEKVVSKVLTTMPKDILRKFVKWIVLQRKKRGAALDEHQSMGTVKEEAILKVLEQLNKLQQMDDRMEDIEKRIVDKSSEKDKYEPAHSEASWAKPGSPA